MQELRADGRRDAGAGDNGLDAPGSRQGAALRDVRGVDRAGIDGERRGRDGGERGGRKERHPLAARGVEKLDVDRQGHRGRCGDVDRHDDPARLDVVEPGPVDRGRGGPGGERRQQATAIN